jgi:hypothetical protein
MHAADKHLKPQQLTFPRVIASTTLVMTPSLDVVTGSHKDGSVGAVLLVYCIGPITHRSRSRWSLPSAWQQ